MKRISEVIVILLSIGMMLYGNVDIKKGAGHINSDTESEVKKKKKLINLSEEQDRYYRNSEEYFSEGLFGSEYVGFINLPEWEDIKWLIDIYSDTYTLEISEDGVDIYSLDSFEINDRQGLNDEETAKNLVEQEFKSYLSKGHDRSNLEIKKIEVSGYKGMQLKVKNISGKHIIKNIFVIGNKVYHANAEGIPAHIDQMEKVILSSWKPGK